MVNIFWNIMSQLVQMIVPLVGIYAIFDFIGSVLFNKRQVFLMSNFYLGLFSGFILFSLFEWFIINFIYLSNCDLFLDLILFKKKRDKLIYTIITHYKRGEL